MGLRDPLPSLNLKRHSMKLFPNIQTILRLPTEEDVRHAAGANRGKCKRDKSNIETRGKPWVGKMAPDILNCRMKKAEPTKISSFRGKIFARGLLGELV
jgi:hypothetical protein